jgi:hypothetical protein
MDHFAGSFSGKLAGFGRFGLELALRPLPQITVASDTVFLHENISLQQHNATPISGHHLDVMQNLRIDSEPVREFQASTHSCQADTLLWGIILTA